ncbi:MAG: inositol 2-dehydrogenase [Candidatus Humimicrobiaceae bacterium]
MNQKDKIKIGIIGGGGLIGKFHTKNIADNFHDVKIKTVHDIKINEIKKWAYDLGIDNITDDHNEIINDPEINCILICSPTPTHVDYIIQAANAKKNIFCEKPIDLDPKKIIPALNVVKKNGIVFQVGFMKRFDRTFLSMKNMVKEGKIGSQYITKITSRDPILSPLDYIKTCGGIFLDMTCHDFDLLRFLTGSEVKEVFAIGETMIEPAIKEFDDFDTTIINLKLKNGSLGLIENTEKTNFGYDQRVEMFGSGGCLSADNPLMTSISLKAGNDICIDNQHYWFMERYKDAYVEEFKSFFESIRQNKESAVGGIDGLKAIQIGLAAKQSAKERRFIEVEEV